jgi:hypothetical protein
MTNGVPHPLLNIDPQVFAFETGMAFEGLTVNPKDEGWNFTLRGRRASGEPVYAMMWFAELDGGLVRLYRVVCSRNARDIWRLDRFRK